MGESAEGFGRLAIGVPLFHPEPEFWLWWTWLVAKGFREGDVLLNDAEIPVEAPHPVVHNCLARAFLETDCDTLLIIEDDHNGDEEVVERMRSKPENWGFDVVCASYVNRRGRPYPIGGFLTGVEGPSGLLMSRDLRDVASSGTQVVDVAALGCVLIRRRVLEAMRGEEKGNNHGGLPVQEFHPFKAVGLSTLDMWFYRECKRLGFRVGVDRDNWITHVGRYVWGQEDWTRAMADLVARMGDKERERGESAKGEGEQ